MLRRVLFAIMVAATPTLAYAGPKEDAQSVFDRFLTAFTAADIDAAVDAFWPDTLFWGTVMPNLATTPGAVREYFKPLSDRKPNERRATSLDTSAVAVSESVVLISGLWQIERVVDGKPTLTPPESKCCRDPARRRLADRAVPQLGPAGSVTTADLYLVHIS